MHHQLWNHTFTHSPPSHWAQWLGGAWVTVPMHHQLRKKNICRLESPMWNSMILDDFGIIRLSSPPSHWAQWLGGAWVTMIIVTTKPLSSVARWCLGNGTPSPPSHWAQWLGGAWVTMIIVTTKPLSSVARWCLGNGTPSPPSHWAQWLGGAGVTVRHHQATELSDGADGFFQKSSSSVTELTDFSKNRAAQSTELTDFSKNRAAQSAVTELTDFSKNRAAQSWRSWRIFPKIEQLSRDGADGFFQKSSSSVVTELTDFSKNRADPAKCGKFPFFL